MTEEKNDSDELVRYVVQTVANPDAIIAIRDEGSKYIWVNEEWENTSTVLSEDIIGKTPMDLQVAPREQKEQFMQEDWQAKRQLRLVSINRYDINGVPVRFMTVRAFIHFRGVGYIVEVSFVLRPEVTESILGWSSARLERAFGEDLASSLLTGGESPV